MHYYTQQTAEYIERMQARVRELEEQLVSAELVIAQALDQIDEGLGRERRLMWTVLGFGSVMTIAIMKCSWMAMEVGP